MFKLSKSSKKKLDTCHSFLQQLVFEVLKTADVTVVCGHRTEAEQNDAYDKGASKLKWPHSKHNAYPSMAVDVVPYPIDWNDIERFKKLSVIVKEAWIKLGLDNTYTLVWGGDWKSFKDYPHWEIR